MNDLLTSGARPLLCVALALCACDEPRPDEDEPSAPVARMFFPQLALAGAPAQFDARASSDKDGDALTYLLNPGDGTPAAESVDGLFGHAYEVAGTFEVELIVTDETGESASAFGDVVIVTDDASCDCDLLCFEDAVCTPRGCELFSSSERDDHDTPSDVIACNPPGE